MLIDVQFLESSRVLHLGAHDAEEHSVYSILDWDVLWVEAIPEKVNKLREQGFNVQWATVWSEETELTFYRTNNDQSSSVLPLQKHADYYPDIRVSDSWVVKTTTVDAICKKWDFWPDGIVLDIQGAELEALKGAENVFPGLQWVYSEISTEPLYRGGVLEPELDEFLLEKGFTQVERSMTDFGWGDAIWVRS